MIFFLITLPFRLVRLGFKTGAGSVKLSHRTVRILGYRRLFFLGAGVAIGLLVAPTSGAELRRKLQELLEGARGAAPADLADKVRDELASSPRTWHLPQPTVIAETGRVTLRGEVPHATAAADLERTVRAVPGVVEVVNQLAIASN